VDGKRHGRLTIGVSGVKAAGHLDGVKTPSTCLPPQQDRSLENGEMEKERASRRWRTSCGVVMDVVPVAPVRTGEFERVVAQLFDNRVQDAISTRLSCSSC
jgi:hypothetical protein